MKTTKAVRISKHDGRSRVRTIEKLCMTNAEGCDRLGQVKGVRCALRGTELLIVDSSAELSVL
jgi:hypothetical protein